VTSKVVVITGLYRTTHDAEYWCAQFSKVIATGCRVVVSTWLEEVEKNADDFRQMRDVGVEVVASRAPTIAGNGNAAFQQIAMKNALVDLDEDDYVLKTRFDFWNDNFISWFISSKCAPIPTDGGVFRSKIIVPSAFLWQYFYIKDIFFVGEVSSIRELLRLPLHLGCYYPNLAPEQFLYWPCFENRSPVIRNCMRSNVGLIFGNEEAATSMVREKLEFSAFRIAIAHYFVLLQQNFAFFADAMNVAAPFVPQAFTLQDIIGGSRPLGTNRHGTVGEAVIESGRFFEALGVLEVDSQAFTHIQASYQALAAGDSLTVSAEEIDAFQEWAVAKSQALGKQDASPGRVRGGVLELSDATGWRLADATDESVALQNEVSRLRRLLESQADERV
jgi:hypothetical protein